MSQNRVPAFLTVLRESQLLEPEQAEELTQAPEAKAGDLNALVKFILQKGWLTRFQLTLIGQGKTKELMFGPYRLLDRLGEGTIGHVFKAYHPPMSRTVALKVIRKEKLPSPQAVQRFYREVQAAAKLAHPNLVVPFDANQINGTSYFAMEYMDGTDLAQLVKQQGPVAPAAACDYIRQAALGLQYALEQGMVHRDIKPQNLLLSRSPKNGSADKKPGAIKILDMGLTQLGGGDSSAAAPGTPDYMAPEQAEDAKKADIRSDLYSLGAVMFFLLTGKPPFQGDTLKELQLRHRLEPAPNVHELRKEVSAPVAAVVARLLAKKPEDRYQTPAELARALEPFCHEAGAANGVPLAAAVPAGMAFELVEEDAEAEVIAVETEEEKEASPFANAPLEPMAPAAALAMPVPRARRPQPAGGVNMGLIAGLGVAALAIFGAIAYVAFLRDTGDKPEPPQAVAAGPGPATPKNPTQPSGTGPRQDPPPAPATFNLVPFGPVNLKGGESKILPIKVERKGTGGKPIDIRLEDLPEGVNSDFASIEPYKDQALIKLVAAPDADTSQGTVRVVASMGKTEIAGEFVLMVQANPLTRGQRINLTNFAAKDAWVLPPDGKQGLTLNSDNAVRIYDLDTGRETKALRNGELGLRGGVLSADGKQVLLGWSDNTVQLVDWQTGKAIRKLDHPVPIEAMAMTPDGKFGLVGGGTAVVENGVTTIKDAAVRVWDLQTGKEVAKLDQPGQLVRYAALTADGTRAATYSEPQTVTFWNVATGQAMFQRSVNNATMGSRMAFTPDGKFLFTGWANVVLVIANDPQVQAVRQIPGIGVITTLAVSPDGKHILTGTEDGMVRLWALETNTEIKTFSGHTARVDSVAFSPDGKRVISASADQTVRIWHVPVPEAP